MKVLIKRVADSVVFAAGFVLYMIAVVLFSKMFDEDREV